MTCVLAAERRNLHGGSPTTCTCPDPLSKGPAPRPDAEFGPPRPVHRPSRSPTTNPPLHDTPGELVQVDIRNSAASPTVADNAGLGGSSATVTTRGRAAVTPSCTMRSTTVPARLFRGALRRTQGGSRPDLGRGSQLLRRTRYRGVDRQRFLLSLTLLRGGARSERHAPLHPPISSADQWKGRAIEPDVGRRIGHTPRCICPTRPARRNTVRLPLGVDTPDTGSSGEPVGMSTWDVSRCIRRISGKTLSRCTARPMANARTQFPVRR